MRVDPCVISGCILADLYDLVPITVFVIFLILITHSCVSSNFRFPPPTMAADEAQLEEVRVREKQAAEQEKQRIVEFEGYLAAATSKHQITEANSLLLAQLTTMDPKFVTVPVLVSAFVRMILTLFTRKEKCSLP